MVRRFFGEPRQYKDKFGFRWRSTEVSRIEGFSDAVFAFSVTLLIVSLEVPKTFADLLQTMRGFIAFAASFAILIWIWHVHYIFFRRYGLQDAFTKTVNAILLFVILFYVYPLKFVFTNVVHWWSGGTNSTTLDNGMVVPIVSSGESSQMMVIYAIGFIAVFVCYVLLYLHARSKAEELRLNPVEVFVTSLNVQAYSLCILIGLLSLSLAYFGGDEYSAWSGISYMLLGPALGIHGFISAGRLKKIESQTQQSGQPQRPPQQQRQGDERRRQFQHGRPQGGPRHQGGGQHRQQRGGQQGQQGPRDQRSQEHRRPQGPPPDQSQQSRKPE